MLSLMWGAYWLFGASVTITALVFFLRALKKGRKAAEDYWNLVLIFAPVWPLLPVLLRGRSSHE